MAVLNRDALVKKYGEENLMNVTKIDFSSSHIKNIDSNTFKGLNKLAIICLNDNEIEEIDVRLFENLPSLTEIWLHNNKLKRVDFKTFQGLTRLAKLWLQNNEIEKIDIRSFECLSNLTEIWLNKNKLKRIDFDTFKGLVKLEKLWLHDNLIEFIDVRSFENLSKLTEIWLHNNHLERIDFNTFKGLANLEKLWLHDNSIEEIDVRLFESLSKLTELLLYNNRIKKIDSNTFNGLLNLETLILNNNRIEEINVRLFENLSKLKVLSLYNNKLKRIDSNTFKSLIKLKSLWLNNNEIEQIDVRLFESLSNLTELSLYYNRIKRIDSNTFKSLIKLESLWLNNNEIEHIDVRLFESLSSLKALYLNNNKLKEIDRKCFERLKSIEVIQTFDNVGLNAISFLNPSTKCWFNKDKVKESELISDWNQFLQQFPELERAANFDDPYINLLLNYRYHVKSKLGRGTFGLVYLVDDTTIDIIAVKKKAMKVMDQLDSATMNELELLSEINHENIVRYYDHFHKKIGGEEKTFLIMEYCENGDLRKKIEAKRLSGNFDERQILNWMSQTANALNYLHSKKPDAIIHRDIKPENMFLSGRNDIKLGDLGISKLMDRTHASTHAGTPIYMSPEVFKAQFMDIDYYPNTDVWSLGCVLYELKFLKIAFPKGQRNDPPIPANVSSSGLFSSILPKMLEKDCSVRITSLELLNELEHLIKTLI